VSKVFSLFQISLENYFKIKYYIYKHLRQQSSEIENWPYYELEYTIENLVDDLKKRNKENEDQQSQQDVSKYIGQSNQMKSINTPKMPSLGKTPSIPRGGVFKMPKL